MVLARPGGFISWRETHVPPAEPGEALGGDTDGHRCAALPLHSSSPMAGVAVRRHGAARPVGNHSSHATAPPQSRPSGRPGIGRTRSSSGQPRGLFPPIPPRIGCALGPPVGGRGWTARSRRSAVTVPRLRGARGGYADCFGSVRFFRLSADGTHARFHDPVVEVVVEAARPLLVTHCSARAVPVLRDPAPATAIVTPDGLLRLLAARPVAARPVPAGAAARVGAEAARIVAESVDDRLGRLVGGTRPCVAGTAGRAVSGCRGRDGHGRTRTVPRRSRLGGRATSPRVP